MLFKECYKIIANRYILTFIFFLFACNTFLLIYQAQKESEYYMPNEYKQIYQQIEGDTPTEALETITAEYNRLQGYEYLYMGEVDKDLFSSLGYEADILLSEYQNSKYYNDYNSLADDLVLYRTICKEISLLTDYESYLESIDIKAQQMTRTNLFAQKDSFSYRNIAKTPTDFSGLKNLQLTVSPSLGVKTATEFPVTDVFIVLITLTSVMILISREKEQGVLSLMHTTPNGRAELGFYKVFACMFIGALSVIILYGMNLIIAHRLYGLGYLSRYIQSVASMNGSCWKIDVRTYLIFFVLSKILAVWSVSALFCLISVISRSTAKCFGFVALVLGVFFSLFYFIPADSVFSIFKYINPIAFFQTFDLYAVYQNRNIFGQPVSALYVFLFGAICIVIVATVLSIILFAKMNVIPLSKKRLHSFNIFKGTHTSVFAHECYKALIGSKIVFVLLCIIVVRVVCTKPIIVYMTPDEIYYNQYIQSVEGVYTEEKEVYISSEQQRLNNLQSDYINELQNADGNTTIFIIMKYQDLLAPKNAVDQLAEHASYLKDKHNSEFIDDRGLKKLTGGDQGNQAPIYLALIVTAFIIICMSEMFGVEYRSQMNNLIETSYGKRKHILSKLIIALILAIFVYIAVYFPYYNQIFDAYSSNGFNAPAYSMEHLSNYSISVINYFLMKNIVRVFGFIIQVITIYFLSRKIRNNVMVIVLSCLIFVVPLLLMLLGIDGSRFMLLNPIIADF